MKKPLNGPLNGSEWKPETPSQSRSPFIVFYFEIKPSEGFWKWNWGRNRRWCSFGLFLQDVFSRDAAENKPARFIKRFLYDEALETSRVEPDSLAGSQSFKTGWRGWGRAETLWLHWRWTHSATRWPSPQWQCNNVKSYYVYLTAIN